MTASTRTSGLPRSSVWILLFLLVAGFAGWRMEILPLEAMVEGPAGSASLSNTFASVDHPFHVARAETLWRELQAGRLLRWVGQHQGGYPVEFYPLGEAWLEVGVRALSLGTLSAGGAHTIAVYLIFLAPGVAFLAMAAQDRLSPAVALLALCLHVALPGGWYDGGYTELVQWGLVTNVAGTAVALLMFPLLIRFLAGGAGWAGGLAALLAAFAVYTNPRSLVALAALGAGAWLTLLLWSRPGAWDATRRLALVTGAAALLAATELLALLRFGGLYTFVQYSGYESLASFTSTSVATVGLPVVIVAIAGAVVAVARRAGLVMRSTVVALVAYVLVTLAVAFVPAIADLAAQLEPTRLMPLQRLLTIYLAAAGASAALTRLGQRIAPRLRWLPAGVTAALAMTLLLLWTRPLANPLPDPASPVIPGAGLYRVARSAQPVQADLEAAVRAADTAAAEGTSLLVLGSALSWHQQLWAPLWTERPLFYDNWLWYWHPWQVGTPGYRPEAGHHYPDPQATLDADYLARQGVGAVVVTGQARDTAASSWLLRPVRQGVYDVYVVREPVTVVTFGGDNAARSRLENDLLAASATVAGSPVDVRQNWFPRWSARVDATGEPVMRRDDGYMAAAPPEPASGAEFRYSVQAMDWLARGLALLGLVGVVAICLGAPADGTGWRWYSPFRSLYRADANGAVSADAPERVS